MGRRGKIRDGGHYMAIQHIRQREELSRLVHGIDVEVLAIFFRFDRPTFERLCGLYQQLFGLKAELYMRETLPTWRSGKTTVSGKNAARLLIVVPLFLNEEQRDTLMARLRAIVWDEQVVRWIYGQNSTVRERIRTAAEPCSGTTVPTLPDRPMPTPPRPQFSSSAVIAASPSSLSYPNARAADPPRSNTALPTPSLPAPVMVPASPRRPDQTLGWIVASIIAFVFFLVFVSSPGRPPRSGSNAPADQRPSSAGSTPSVSVSPNAPSGAVPSPVVPIVVPRPPPPLVTPPPVPTSLEVKYVRLANRQASPARIERLGGTNPDGTLWALSQEDAIAGARNGKYEFFMLVKGRRIDLQPTTDGTGSTTLKAQGDGRETISLSKLPGFPPVARPVPFPGAGSSPSPSAHQLR